MASFQKRGNTWQFTISRYVNGKYKPIRQGGFRTKKEAEVVATEIENKLNKRKVPHLTPVVFSSYFLEWIDIYKPNISKNTRARYLNTYHTIKGYFGNSKIQDITKRDYQLFINKYGKKRSRETVRKLNSHIRACVLEAIDEGIIFKDFTRNVELTGRLTPNKVENYLHYEGAQKLNSHLKLEIDQMIKKREIIESNIDLRYFAILIILNTGLRFGEVVGLTENDIDFDSNTIHINKTWGYSNKMVSGFGKTKNYEDRKIKIGDELAYYIKKLIQLSIENEFNLLFYEPSSKYKVISNSGVNNLLKNTLNQLNLEQISIHGLRHTHASILLYKKVSIEYVSERLGHRDIVTTYKFYSHVIKELRKDDEEKTIKIFK